MSDPVDESRLPAARILVMDYPLTGSPFHIVGPAETIFFLGRGVWCSLTAYDETGRPGRLKVWLSEAGRDRDRP